MGNRPSGTATSSPVLGALAAVEGHKRRQVITGKIRGQTGLGEADANRPSAHLRWGLQQMKARGWRNDDWGQLLEDDRETLGTGPICLLESVQSPADAPSALELETDEQFYLRRAFIELGWDVPLYLSEWNDAQETFEPVETLMLKAIELAEADEREHDTVQRPKVEYELRRAVGITQEMLDARVAEQKGQQVT